MGVAGLWDAIRPAGVVRSLTNIAVTEGFIANPGGLRGFRVGIDASIWFFHAEYGREGENPVLRTLFFRCATLMNSPFLPLFVFDGPKRPDLKRGKKINKTSHKLIPGMKMILESFGFEWRMAPGEAEAELAYLNRIGLIDGILSDDVDNFLFGAATVIRNPSNNLSGNKANPTLNADGRDDKNHTRVFRMADITLKVGLTRGGMILIGLMSGGDYEQGGLARCGPTTAHGLAKCGFGDSLFKAATTLSRKDLQSFLINWRHELCHELRTNSQGHIGRKQVALANSITSDFPNIDILLSYTNPITSESMGRTENNTKLAWAREPDLGKLAATCEFYFEWGYKEAIIKRFRTVIWHGAILRILRRAVLDLDAKRSLLSPALPPSTPRKANKPELLPIGTPSKMIAKHFSSLAISDLDDDDESSERLTIKIHSEREHASTDKILEYRLEVAPAQLVRLAESGIKGTRLPEGPDEWASEDEDDDSNDTKKKGTKKTPPDPQSHMRVWMPAVMVSLVEPSLVEQYEASKRQKLEKKSGNRSNANEKLKTVPVIDVSCKHTDVPVKKSKAPTRVKLATSAVAKSESSDSPRIRDPTKAKPSDLRDYFAGTKSSVHVQKKGNARAPTSQSCLSSGRSTSAQKHGQSSIFASNTQLSHPTNSPRTSSNHTSPRRNPQPELNIRPVSPSPLRPLKGTSKSSIIEISDSDDDLEVLSVVPPLLLARARVQKNTIPKTRISDLVIDLT